MGGVKRGIGGHCAGHVEAGRPKLRNGGRDEVPFLGTEVSRLACVGIQTQHHDAWRGETEATFVICVEMAVSSSAAVSFQSQLTLVTTTSVENGNMLARFEFPLLETEDSNPQHLDCLGSNTVRR